MHGEQEQADVYLIEVGSILELIADAVEALTTELESASRR
jgi:hypothetical protein